MVPNDSLSLQVRDLRVQLLGQRVSNIYDVNNKTYLFKFAVPGKSEKVIAPYS